MNAEPRQRWYEILGKNGCYVLCLNHLAERFLKEYIDAYATFLSAMQKGYVRDDCYVRNPSGVISMLTGYPWSFTKEGPGYKCKMGEHEILRFERQEVGNLISHFVVGDGNGNVFWDPYEPSETVKNGDLVSKRIFRKI